MDATSTQDLRKVRKLLLIALVFYMAFNHTVRIFSSSSAPAASGFDFTGTIGSSTIQSLDVLRRRSGESLQRVQHLCPASVEGMCSTAVHGLRQVLGI